MQISVSAWTAEALKLTMPASVFSRSTECHNQDKVSMGTIAARDAIRVLELTEQVAAACLAATAQALESATDTATARLRAWKPRSTPCATMCSASAPSWRRIGRWSMSCGVCARP